MIINKDQIMQKQIVNKLIERKIPLPVALLSNLDQEDLLDFLTAEEFDYFKNIDNEITIAKDYFNKIEDDEPIPESAIKAMKKALRYYSIYGMCYDWYWQNIIDYDFDKDIINWITDDDAYIKLTKLYKYYLEWKRKI